ncbi:ATP-binding protein [Streptomyces sp. TM32]|nr:ATP-binding protein [Streptomyces sp. TM32]
MPPPAVAPPSDPVLVRWLRAPRTPAGPGIWTLGHRPRPDKPVDEPPLRQLVFGVALTAFAAWLLGSLLYHSYLGSWWLWPLAVLGPQDPASFVIAAWVYYAIWAIGLTVAAARIGRWRELARRTVGLSWRRLQEQNPQTLQATPARAAADPVQWPDLRAHGAVEAADRLTAEVRSGRMTEVDAARILHVWDSVRAGRIPTATFTATVLKHGAAAYAHPSGHRNLARRTARHDLLARQVRIGTAADVDRTPHAYRGAGMALQPSLLGTSLLAVGPAGSGKLARIVRPVVEAMALQALAGQCALVAVGPAGAALGPDDAFDVVVRLGQPNSDHDLDLYGGTPDPDEAAAILAEALVGDSSTDTRRAGAALAQLLGPFRTAHERFPSVPELRELLDDAPQALDTLRAALTAQDTPESAAALRELDVRTRQAGRPDDVAMQLADRIARLDRPAFASFFNPAGGTRQVSLRALDRPLRVRIDLPDRGHVEASRILARLILAQFTESAAARTGHPPFACLVLADAAQTITADALRGLQRLRSANAGAVLTLRSLEDVPPALRGSLLGAVGCRMAFAGVTTWDGTPFAEVWGKEWVETRDVTDRQIIAEGAGMKAMHLFRQAVTGKAVTAQAVTVRTVERERWSASDLAHTVPAGHAVLSVTSVTGDSAPPLLVDLRADATGV